MNRAKMTYVQAQTLKRFSQTQVSWAKTSAASTVTFSWSAAHYARHASDCALALANAASRVVK
jgi:hypothetical protein